MSGRETDRPRRRRRNLSGEERALWRNVTQAVTPLRPADALDHETEDEPTAMPIESASVPAIAGGGRPAIPPREAPPPLAPLDRRLKQRVARGSAALDARIDLHGFTQERAHNALLRFLRKAQADGAKLTLVITGKGARPGDRPGDGERGVLKRAVPQWLGLREFRRYVVGFESAHVSHGGEGALYVRVRRAR